MSPSGGTFCYRFTETLVPPYVIEADLESAYQAMAADELREAEVQEWAEATVGDVADLGAVERAIRVQLGL